MKSTANREILIRDEEEPNPEYGKSPEDRSVEELLELGVINLDKPVGPSSHEVTAWLKKALNVNKIAHAGTLEGLFPGVILKYQEYCPFFLIEL